MKKRLTSLTKNAARDSRSNADGRVADVPSTRLALVDPTDATWWFNSRCLPSVGGPLTDAELNHSPLPERVVQHLVDPLFRFYELYAQPTHREPRLCV